VPEYTARQRAEMLEHVGLNVFFFPSEMVTGCDLLSDSGTTSMTNEQWAALHLGDEAYGSNKGYFLLAEQVRKTFGDEFFGDPAGRPTNAFLFHQGRACEDALFSLLAQVAPGGIVPSNGHFDTTAANISANGLHAVNLPYTKCRESNCEEFQGGMDAERLREVLESADGGVPVVYLTITNNTGGGQPVSMANIREVWAVCQDHAIPLFFDACRFAENAWFIKERERGYANREVIEIVHEMFSYADGFTISFKKDGLSNMGGGLFLRNNGVFMSRFPRMSDELMNWQILKEGHPTYGGMTGRDIMALVSGLETITKEGYLRYRVSQVQCFGESMGSKGVPVVMPVGGHAVYVDIDEFFADTDLSRSDFGGVSLAALLLAGYGHRACELGCFAFGQYNAETRTETFPDQNYLRFAVPRLRYEYQDLESVAIAMQIMHDRRDAIPGVFVTYGRELPLRHFKARFEFKKLAPLDAANAIPKTPAATEDSS
jgi:tryptophanase